MNIEVRRKLFVINLRSKYLNVLLHNEYNPAITNNVKRDQYKTLMLLLDVFIKPKILSGLKVYWFKSEYAK